MFLLARSSAVGAGNLRRRCGGIRPRDCPSPLLPGHVRLSLPDDRRRHCSIHGRSRCGLVARPEHLPGKRVQRLHPRPACPGASGFLLPPLLLRVRESGLASMQIHVLFTASAFAVACLVGMEFALASRVRQGRAAVVASELYGLDLAGSASGRSSPASTQSPSWACCRQAARREWSRRRAACSVLPPVSSSVLPRRPS